jgi:hypothetical protein
LIIREYSTDNQSALADITMSVLTMKGAVFLGKPNQSLICGTVRLLEVRKTYYFKGNAFEEREEQKTTQFRAINFHFSRKILIFICI